MARTSSSNFGLFGPTALDKMSGMTPSFGRARIKLKRNTPKNADFMKHFSEFATPAHASDDSAPSR
jgi:hypothetical protein